MVRPRFMVWENVHGAFSSNKGRDFAAVLEEIIRIAEPEAPDIEVPEKGWPTWGGYHDEVGGRWSVAWRVHDAQYWGVPQRRRRISVVADFGGDTAGEILFERKSVSRHPAESGTTRERLDGAAQDGASYAVRIRGGCDGGGKGALVQTDKSGTLGTGNDQTIFTAISINGNVAGTLDANYYKGCGVRQGIEREVVASFAAIPINDKATRWQGGGESRNHDGSGNGLGIGKEGDPSPTLTAGDRHGVAYILGVDGYNGDLTGDVASTIGVNCGMSTGRNGVMELSANENGGMARDSVMCAGFKLGNSEQARSIGYAEEQSPTLNAECGVNKPAVVTAYSFDSLASNSMKSKNPNSGCRVVDVAKTMDTYVPDPSKNQGGIAVLCLNDQGGNVMGVSQVPLTYQAVTGTLSPGAHAGSYNGQDAYNDMLVCGANCQQAFAQKRFAEYDSAENAVSIRASGCDYGGGSETLVASQNMVARRLTPMECERLQGFPDGWTDIGEWRDSKGKLRKPSDSPRYKALGNSIALPFWDFLAKRISAQYLRPVTMGSLFDGIGGFPLVFERHNGKGTARWASEIEEFPIAVTKLRFGED